MSFHLHGNGAGVGHDQLRVAGAVDLGGATLEAIVGGGYVPAVGERLLIVDNDGAADPVVGTFAGIAEGGAFTSGGHAFRVSYAGGDGNDVVLTAAAASTTSVAGSAASSLFAQSVTFTATVAGSGGVRPTGAVEFFYGDASLGSVPLADDGTATLATASLAIGTHAVRAVYGGAGDLAGSASQTPAAIDVANNAPTAGGIAPVVVAEDADPVTRDLAVAFDDVEDGDALTFELVGATDRCLFDDLYVSGDTLNVAFRPDENGTSTVTIRAVDSLGAAVEADLEVAVSSINDPGSLQFMSTAFHVDEDAGFALLTAVRTGGTDGAVAVDYALAPGGTAAGAGVDYTMESGILAFAEGQLATAIKVPLVNDPAVEGDETIVVRLGEAEGGASVGDRATTTLTIADAVNHAPAAADRAGEAAAGAAATYANLGTDADGDALRIDVAVPPVHGTARVVGTDTPSADDDGIEYVPAPGAYAADRFVYTVTDKHGASATGTIDHATASGATVLPSAITPGVNDLVLHGTTGDDQILVSVDQATDEIVVEINGVGAGRFADVTGRVLAFGLDGNDTVRLSDLTQAGMLYGGDGDDRLEGSRGADVLLGGAGGDVLDGWEKRDLLVGGDGADLLAGGANEDAFVGGSTSYDADAPANRLALADLLTAWTGPEKLAQRSAQMAAGVGVTGARLGVGTLLTDDVPDTLVDATPKDWIVDEAQ